MVTLEQIKLLETKIARAINFMNQLTEENIQLKKQNDELERITTAMREEKARMEEGISSIMGRLNQFEDTIGQSISGVKKNPPSVPKEPAPQAKRPAVPVQSTAPEPMALPVQSTAPEPLAMPEKPKPAVPSAYLIDESGEETADEESRTENPDEAELDIF